MARASNDVFKSRHASNTGLSPIDAILENEASMLSKRGVIPRCISELFH